MTSFVNVTLVMYPVRVVVAGLFLAVDSSVSGTIIWTATCDELKHF